ncbi:MAG: P-II family nitrogen regulator [Methanocalculus sp. MSAO_Arc1]|uniref:P-II family nitrogen regulator n=1 Tax=Methanocalculus TaxID=71151 RepID=UPI000FF4390E|nr:MULTISPECIES: P-II family nitrogen regulator [unclassified Methanocalculus]MCP1662348.1 nitrogen regulatory protein P-II 1 [Methanocalculus sp. AMF5]RQD81528.1 MAG: P-II family nitrogen regulator [Methanocalculus sp. MSAO_Arc1]
MKKIEAVIRPERYEIVEKNLEDQGFTAMTVSEVKGRGSQKGITLQYRGGTMQVNLLPKIKIEMVVEDEDLERAVAIIQESARTGKVGDGRIFVLPVEKTYWVRKML